MLLNVAKYVLHICLVSVEMMVAVMILCIVIRAASVTMTGSWELHVHYRCLIRKVLGFAVVFGRPMVTVGSVRHEISVWKTIIMQIGVGEFLLVHLYFVEFGSHLAHLRVGMSSADLATEDVSSLGSCSLWSLAPIQRVGPVMVSCPRVYFCDHLHLVGIAHNKLFLITSIWGSNSALSRTTRNDLTLGCYCWNFIVILLNRGQINVSTLLKIRIWRNKIRASFIFRGMISDGKLVGVTDWTYRLGLFVIRCLQSGAYSRRMTLTSIRILRSCMWWPLSSLILTCNSSFWILCLWSGCSPRHPWFLGPPMRSKSILRRFCHLLNTSLSSRSITVDYIIVSNVHFVNEVHLR